MTAMTQEQINAALAKLPELQRDALLQVLQEGDEYYAMIKAALANPLIAASPAAQGLKNAEMFYITQAREALKTALKTYGVEIAGPVVLPGGVLALPKPPLTRVEFMDKVGPFAVAAVMQAAAAQPGCAAAVAYEYLRVADHVRLEDPRTRALVEGVVAQGVWPADVISVLWPEEAPAPQPVEEPAP